MQALCSHCGGMRAHSLLHSLADTQQQPSNEQVRQRYEILKCAGCGNIHIEVTTTTWQRGDYANRAEARSLFPPAPLRPSPPWLGSIGDAEISALMHEVYVAASNELYRCAAMAVRAVLERMMTARLGLDHGTFAKNIEAFFDAGHISLAQKDVFTAVIDVGSASIHRAHAPTRSDVDSIIATVETVLNTVYLQPAMATALRASTPPRAPRLKKGKP